MKITVRIRSVYGIETVYPACDHAKLFARIAGTKTLTTHALRDIRLLGYDIEAEREEPRILARLTA